MVQSSHSAPLDIQPAENPNLSRKPKALEIPADSLCLSKLLLKVLLICFPLERGCFLLSVTQHKRHQLMPEPGHSVETRRPGQGKPRQRREARRPVVGIIDNLVLG